VRIERIRGALHEVMAERDAGLLPSLGNLCVER
jgi:hypothetical protein